MAALQTISSMATRALLAELAAAFAAASGTPVRTEAAGGVDVARRLRNGERVDLVLLAHEALQSLAAEGWVQAPRLFAVSTLEVAVPADGPRPRIETVEDVRHALLNVPAIGYSTGPSGQALLALLERLGLRQALQARLRQARDSRPDSAR